jgi:hypothetical protein
VITTIIQHIYKLSHNSICCHDFSEHLVSHYHAMTFYRNVVCRNDAVGQMVLGTTRILTGITA